MSNPDGADETAAKHSAFPPTRWTWIRQAQDVEEQISEMALNQLCGAYWYPLFVTGRRKLGLDHHQSQDMVQGFWGWFIEKDHLQSAHPERGKFRSFLTTYFENYARNEWRTDNSKKRGGGAIMVSKDSDEWNSKCEAEMGLYASADEHLDKAWQMASVEAAFREVEASWARRGKGDIFEALKTHLKEGGERGAYRGISEKLKLTEENVRQHSSQLRKDLRASRAKWLGSRRRLISAAPLASVHHLGLPIHRGENFATFAQQDYRRTAVIAPWRRRGQGPMW